MSDLIDRQKAIDEINKLEYPSSLVDVKRIIVDLPSAEPGKRTEERTETHACDCISRQAAMDEMSKQHTYKMFVGEDTVYLDANDVGSVLASLPAAQPERKTGRWEMLQIPISPPVYKCSVCGGHALVTLTGRLLSRHYEANLTDFCPSCGADMGGEQDGSD